MKRSASLPHIPLRENKSKRQRPNGHNFKQSTDSSSLLTLPDDLLIRILHLLLKSDVINVSSRGNLKEVISLASTCQRLQTLFFSSIREIDSTIEGHIRHDLPHNDHNLNCTTCPLVIKLPLLIQFIKKTNKSLKKLKLSKLDNNSTRILLNLIVEFKCFQLTELHITDNSSMYLSNSLQSIYTLKHLEIHQPSINILKNLIFLNCQLKVLSLYCLNSKLSQFIIDYLYSNNSLNLNSLTLYFYNNIKFLPDSFNFPKFNLHSIYPDVHLDISKGILDIINFISIHKVDRLPLLHTLNIQTVGVDLNHEPCDLINCPPPFKDLDPLCGTVKLIRDAMLSSSASPSSSEASASASPTASASASSLSLISLRTDHPLLVTSLKALSPLLTPNLLFTLHVHDLTLTVPPIESDILTLSKLSEDEQALAMPSFSSNEILNHSIISIRLESLLHREAPRLSNYTSFSKLRVLDISSINFCIEYGKNREAHRPKLIKLLKQSENSLKIIRISNFFNNGYNNDNEILLAKAYLIDILSYSIKVRILELSDEFLISTLFDHKNISDIFIYLSNFHIIRFGSIQSIFHSSSASNTINNYNNQSHFQYSNIHFKFINILPKFLNLLKNSCPNLKSLILFSMYYSQKSNHLRMVQPLRNCIRALHELEKELPGLDTYTLRAQFKLWLTRKRI